MGDLLRFPASPDPRDDDDFERRLARIFEDFGVKRMDWSQRGAKGDWGALWDE